MERKANNNEALEALDFIINVLKEHEKDLDRLINQLGIITENLGQTGEIAGKIEKIENSISTLQSEITSLEKSFSMKRRGSPSSIRSKNPMNILCRKWEDFKNLATGAETVSYVFKVSESSFQAAALKNGEIVSYSGDYPPNTILLKLWLSKELDVDEGRIFEGVLKIG